MFIYELESEDLTGLGGPMGSEQTSTNWRRFFKGIKRAKKVAEDDYKENSEPDTREKIRWSTSGEGLTTGDLRFVMYNIRRIKVED
jgi:hypothetical protein